MTKESDIVIIFIVVISMFVVAMYLEAIHIMNPKIALAMFFGTLGFVIFWIWILDEILIYQYKRRYKLKK